MDYSKIYNEVLENVRCKLWASIRSDFFWQPKRGIQPWMKPSITDPLGIDSSGRTSVQRVKRSIRVGQYLYKCEGANGPIISICTWKNLRKGVSKFPKGVFTCLKIFER